MVKIYLLDGTIIETEDLQLKFHEKLAHEIISNIGTIAVLEVEIEIPNLNGEWSLENVNSPYYGRIGTGCIIEVEGMEFIITEWDAPISSSNARIRGIDKASMALEQKAPFIRLKRNIKGQDAVKLFWEALGFETVFYTVRNEKFPLFWITSKADEAWDNIAKSLLIFAKYEGGNQIGIYDIGFGRNRENPLIIDTFENAPELFPTQKITTEAGIKFVTDIRLGEQKELAKTTIELAPKTVQVVEVTFEPALFLYANSTNAKCRVLDVSTSKVEIEVINETVDVITSEVKVFGKPVVMTFGTTKAGSNLLEMLYIFSRESAELINNRIRSFSSVYNNVYEFSILTNQKPSVGDVVYLRSRYLDEIAIISSVDIEKAGNGFIARGKAIKPVAIRSTAFILPFFSIEFETEVM
jgi:hypothetical protein